MGRNDQIKKDYVTYGLIETGEVTVGSIRKIDLSEETYHMIGNGHKPENKIHSFFSPHVDMSWMPCRGGLLSIRLAILEPGNWSVKGVAKVLKTWHSQKH